VPRAAVTDRMSSMLRHVARALLGAVFIQTGIDQIRRPQARAEAAAPYIDALSRRTGIPDDPILLIRVNGAVMVAGGVGLVTETAPRASAAVLAAGLIPTTVFGHQFWAAGDPSRRGHDSVQFLKNAGLLGGLLLAAIDHEGRPGLRWRARDTSHRAGRAARRAGKAARRETRNARRALTAKLPSSDG